MKSDIDKFIGTWGNDAGNLLVITKSTDLIALVSFFTGPNTSPAIRSYYENKPSIDMYSYLAAIFAERLRYNTFSDPVGRMALK
jgi:hypothetical protein